MCVCGELEVMFMYVQYVIVQECICVCGLVYIFTDVVEECVCGLVYVFTDLKRCTGCFLDNLGATWN